MKSSHARLVQPSDARHSVNEVRSVYLESIERLLAVNINEQLPLMSGLMTRSLLHECCCGRCVSTLRHIDQRQRLKQIQRLPGNSRASPVEHPNTAGI